MFSLHLLSIVIWGIGSYLIGINKNQDVAISLWVFAYAGVIFIPVFFLHVIYLLINEKNKIPLYFAYAQAFFFLCINLSGRMFSALRLMFNSIYYPQANSYVLLSFILWVVTIFFGYIKLTQYYKYCGTQLKSQIFILLWVIPLGFSGGSMNYLPVFGIGIYPYGNLLVSIYIVILTYAILKYDLFEIVIVIKKGVVYSILIAFLSLLYLLIVFLLERFMQALFNYHSITISIATAFALGLVFIPLRHKIQRFFDRYFFKGTQEEIALQNEQLRQEIARSDKYKTLSTLASGVAHEIKNPLTSIQTFCEYLPRKIDDKEFLLKFSRLVGKEVERIDHLVHQLLNYGKPAPLSLKDINIHKLISDTVDVLNSHFIVQRIDVNKDFDSGTKLHLCVDPNQVRQALLNVLLNAVEAMPHGGQLQVVTDVEPKTNGEGSFVIRIKDSGHGISPEDLKHIFDPFFSRKDNGTGLGLAIVQGIVEQHGGKIRIESKAGVGTTVKLEFPLQ